jgi:hypothetical protein
MPHTGLFDVNSFDTFLFDDPVTSTSGGITVMMSSAFWFSQGFGPFAGKRIVGDKAGWY